ncbi:MAG: hypothetical protein JST08_10530, partial [Actinobacteria bacterium]|nr:hypothetical protein [Actinomycetota bacterium]
MLSTSRLIAVTLLVASMGVAAGCGSSSSGGSGTKPAATKNAAALERTPVPSFPPATKEVANVKWNLIYGEPQTLDVGHIINYGDEEVMSNLCEPLEYLLPDGSREPALATSIDEPNPTTYVVHVRKGVKF